MRKKFKMALFFCVMLMMAACTNPALERLEQGDIYRDQGQWDEAIAEYSEAIELDPDYAQAYNNRGWIYRTKTEYDNAIADFNKAIELDPSNHTTHTNLGSVYHSIGKYDKAIAEHNKAIELEPGFAAAYFNRGNEYLAKEDLDKAITDYDKAIGLDSELTHAYNNRGWAYIQKGEYDKAIVDYNRAIELNPNYANSYYVRGDIYRTQGKIVEAIADYEKFIGLSQDSPKIQAVQQLIKELQIRVSYNIIKIEETDSSFVFTQGWKSEHMHEASGDTWALTYHNAFDYTNIKVDIKFNGTGISLVHILIPFGGIANIKIDGKDYPDIDMYAPYAELKTTIIATELTNSEHILTISPSIDSNPDVTLPEGDPPKPIIVVDAVNVFAPR